MAEARTEEEEEENLRRDTREPAVRRQSSGGRPDRRKPEHRLSQGPLSSIRAVIKRTSTRSTSLSETPRERERDRRRPEITILSAGPLTSSSSSSWFPPPPPPPSQVWGATIPPSVQPPPSYEEVLREKTQEEQVLLPTSSSSSSSTSTLVTSITISTQTGPEPPHTPEHRPLRPPRPPLPSPPKPHLLDDITVPAHQSRPASSSSACCDLLGDLCSPLTPPTAERPRPRPRSKVGLQPISSEVKVQTLVKLREDGLATLAAAHSGSATPTPEAGGGRYLQELLEAFSSDDWGFPDHHSNSCSQSEEEEEEMATLRARILAFEQQAANGSEGGGASGTVQVAPTRAEPQPRPRLQGRPTIGPKPKTLPPDPPPPQSETPPLVTPPKPHSTTATPVPAPVPTPVPAPVPAPRPPPLKLISSQSDAPKAPPRPTVAPRVSSAPAPSPGQWAGLGGGVQTGEENQSPAAGNVRPNVPTKPPALTSPRRASTPSSAPTPTGTPPNPAPTKPSAQRPAVPVPASRKVPAVPTRTDPEPSDPPPPTGPSSVKPLPLRPPPVKSTPGRPPPPTVSSAPSANQTAAQRASKRGPPLPPRPKPGHPLYSSPEKQEVLIVLDDQSSAPSEPLPAGTPLINPSQCLLDLDTQQEPALLQDGQSKAALEGLGVANSQSILPVRPVELKDQSDPPVVSGPRCVATFDYDGEEEEELTFSQGDVIALLELVSPEWGRGQIHGRVGVFPLNFTKVLEPLPPPPSSTGTLSESTAAPELSPGSDSQVSELQLELRGSAPRFQEEEWVVALFGFPGQAAGDLSFQQGALIQVTQHVDAQWRRGRLEGREGLYPAAFTEPCQARPITDQRGAGPGVAKALFDFTAENEDELTLKVGDIITEVESVDEQWIVGVASGRRGIVPRSFVSPL